MTFASEAQRRWFFANQGGSGGSSGGTAQFSKRELPPASSDDKRAVMREWAQRDSAEAAAAQAEVDRAYANYHKAQDEHFNRMADYWQGGSGSGSREG